MSDNVEELETLLIEWDAGTLDEAGVARVREILRADPEARAFYIRSQMVEAALKLESDAGLAIADGLEPEQETPIVTPVRRTTEHVLRISYWAAIAASVLFCVMAGRLAFLEFVEGERIAERRDVPEGVIASTDESGEERQEATAVGVALVTRLVDVAWDESQKPLEVGDALSPGRLAIESGFAQVEFFCGATVILEGPAELDLESPTLARVRQGRLRAQVPPAARGFSLIVDDMKVVDLGTEFGLSVSPEGADVQVFDGEVELQRPSAEKQLLTAGQSMLRNADGSYEPSEVTPESFVDIAELESRAEGQRDSRYQRWREWSNQLRTDPRLIAYYAFDQDATWKRKLTSSVVPINEELDGAIVGAHRVDGRWPKKGALEFKRPGDRVRVQVPGEYDSLTFACWTKIDSLDRWYNSLFLTDNYNQGEPHWQILDTGQLFFSVRSRTEEEMRSGGPAHYPVLSPPFWKPSMSGKWLHLATTYDVETSQVTHYLDGEVLYAEAIPDELSVGTTRIGAASIGNWSAPTKPDASFAVRNLNGSIDEFAVFAAALSAEEIREMFENGKP